MLYVERPHKWNPHPSVLWPETVKSVTLDGHTAVRGLIPATPVRVKREAAHVMAAGRWVFLANVRVVDPEIESQYRTICAQITALKKDLQTLITANLHGFRQATPKDFPGVPVRQGNTLAEAKARIKANRW